MKKKLLLGASLALIGVALAACNTASSEKRNTVTPYGKLNDKLSTVIATANGGKYEMTLDQYYTKLKNKGYSVVTTALNKLMFKDYVKAIDTMYKCTDLTSVPDTDKQNVINCFTYEEDGQKLFELTAEKYSELRTELLTSINTALQSNIIGLTSADAIKNETAKSLNTRLDKFIDSQARLGYTITRADIKWIYEGETGYELTAKQDVVQFSSETIAKVQNLYDNQILTEAQNLSAKNALYVIADDEYITEIDEDDEEKEVKNSNYIFNEDKFESIYDQSFKTFGEYNAIIIQFNSRRDAELAIEEVGGIPTDKTQALDAYLSIYKKYYGYKTDSSVTIDSDCFKFQVNEKYSDLDDYSSSISSLLTEKLEAGDFFVEARNIDNKYVLVYKNKVEYTYPSADDSSKQLAYADLDEAKKAEMNLKLKENLINANYSSYKSTNFNKLLENAELKVYDPYFEYKIEYAYTDYYNPIEVTVDSTSNTIFESIYGSYTVEEFYSEASKQFATPIFTEYFQLSYANEYYNSYVEQELIAEDNHEDNEETLDKAISSFKKNENSTYPSYIGLETYLIASYGYKTKDEILKYHYDANAALSAYKNKLLFEEWSKKETTDNETVFVISDEAKNGFLNNILATGNSTYNDLFSINLDHILINIDDNADGTPDDPNTFLNKNPQIKNAFEAAVEKLAKAIYLEATHDDYKDNSLFDTLKYIKSQYEEGKELRSNPGHTWDEYKEFNFLLTVEQLASSGDITQDSVSNFVVPFKEYVENIYKTASTNDTDSEYENGTFYFVYNDADGNVAGSAANTTENADLVTFDNLCATNYGYHMIVLNSYKGPDSTKFTSKDDPSESQKNAEIIIKEYKNDPEDKDDDTNIYIVTDSYNEDANKASFNQLFIYYVQQKNSDTSILDSDISKVLGSLFNEAITTYSSSNFQTFLLLDLLNIEIKDVEIADTKLSQAAIDAEITYYANQVTGYDSESNYKAWVDGSLNWARPDVIKEN